MAAPGKDLLAYERRQLDLARVEPPDGRRPRDPRSRLVVGTAAVLLLGIGVALGIVARNRGVDQQTRGARNAEQQGSSLRREVSGQQATIDRQQRQITDQQDQLQRQQTQLAEQQAQRQHAAANAATSFGDGIYQVGVGIQPGQYRTNGSGDCYWAKLSTGNTNDVIVNDFAAGPQTVTIDSSYFESEGCGTWTKASS